MLSFTKLMTKVSKTGKKKNSLSKSWNKITMLNTKECL